MPSTVFDHPIFPGAKIIKKTITVTNTSGAYSETITDDRISAGMQVNKMYIEDPSVFRSDISVQTLGGSFVFSCSDVVGTTDVTLEFLKIADDPNGITSTEFNVLNNKIGEVPEGSTLQGEIDEINENLVDVKTVHSIALQSAATETETTVSTYNERKFSDYKILYFIIQDNTTSTVIRNCVTVPSAVWKSGAVVYVIQNHGSTLEMRSGIAFKYNSDTTFRVVTLGEKSFTGYQIIGAVK